MEGTWVGAGRANTSGWVRCASATEADNAAVFSTFTRGSSSKSRDEATAESAIAVFGTEPVDGDGVTLASGS